jgi:hypothetical protein
MKKLEAKTLSLYIGDPIAPTTATKMATNKVSKILTNGFPNSEFHSVSLARLLVQCEKSLVA